MDIDLGYLYFLQQLRQMMGGSLDEIFNGLSKFAVDLLPYLPYIIYWSVHKKWGMRYLTIFNIGNVLNGIVKLTVCAYRPWIRSDLIQPAGDSKVAATRYSFPSGHSTEATSVYMTTAVWQRNSNRKLSVACVILLILTGFSRNYLGVHTPQDVFVGITLTSFVIFLVLWLEQKIGDNQKIYDYLTFAAFPILVLCIVYILNKSYPMDYIDGNLIVDPVKMMPDTFKSVGAAAGFLVAAYIDRHSFHYEIPTGAPLLPLMTAGGVLILIAWKTLFGPATFLLLLGNNWGNLIIRFLFSMLGVLWWPMIITKVCAKKQ